MPTAKPMETLLIKDYPKLIYTTQAFKTLIAMMNTTHAKTKEFLFLGLVHKEKNDYIVEDFLLVPQQKCSTAYCETDDEAYPQWLAENVPLEQRSLIRLHGHSHVNMGTTPSGTDDTQIKELCNNVSDFFIQLIVNHNMVNTINIWDKTNKIIYNNLEQYIEINGILIKLTSKAAINIPQLKIPDGDYKVKDGCITFLRSNIKLDIINGFTYIYDNNIILSNNPKCNVSLIDEGNAYQNEINNQMTKYIKAPVIPAYPTYPTYDDKYGDYPYTQQSFYDDDIVDDTDYNTYYERKYSNRYNTNATSKKVTKSAKKGVEKWT